MFHKRKKIHMTKVGELIPVKKKIEKVSGETISIINQANLALMVGPKSYL